MQTGLAVSLTLLAFGCKPKLATTSLKSEDASGYQCDEWRRKCNFIRNISFRRTR